MQVRNNTLIKLIKKCKSITVNPKCVNSNNKASFLADSFDRCSCTFNYSNVNCKVMIYYKFNNKHYTVSENELL